MVDEKREGHTNSPPSITVLNWWDLETVAEADESIFGATAWSLNFYWAVKAQPGTAMFLARTGTGEFDTKQLAGWIVMSKAGAEADVMTIATTDSSRGQGVGRRLLESGIEWARGQGAHSIHLEVDSTNVSAIALYRRIGFEQWGTRPDYYPGADALLMKLRLPG